MSFLERPLTHAERGARGAASRWGDPANRKVVRLDNLSTPQRAIVLALVAAARSATQKVEADDSA